MARKNKKGKSNKGGFQVGTYNVGPQLSSNKQKQINE